MLSRSGSYTIGYLFGFWIVQLFIKLFVVTVRTILSVIAFLLGFRAPKKQPVGFHANRQSLTKFINTY